MRLIRIDIRNFRLLRRVSMELAKDSTTTVLVGPNNCGKTSVVDALRLFAGEHKRIQIHDFALARRSAFTFAQGKLEMAVDDAARISVLQRFLPRIRVDMTFEYADIPEDLNIVTTLLMNLEPDSNTVTIRVEFSIQDALALWKCYKDRRKPEDTTLFDVLAKDLHAYFGLNYFKVSSNGRVAQRLDDGAITRRLIKIDTVPAQRHMDDDEATKSARLSKLLHDHYATYIRSEEQAGFEAIEDAISESSDQLTVTYEQAFNRLLTRLREFGYPQGYAKPDMKIRAEMTSATIYRDSTKVYYAAPTDQLTDQAPLYELPERYNGLGYKNLIFMVLQLESFRAGIDADIANRPCVHLVGIEEPEAHLHPQMQTIFIKEISKALGGADGPTAQVLLSTHSPHMVADSGFSPIRYFKREHTKVVIRDLSQLPLTATGGTDPATTIKFLKRYIKLTHCDLLFADKAILVEGQVEKLLLPVMIQRVAAQDGYQGLASQYLSVLEIGGAYAHMIDAFLRFLGIPTLVITDIDSATADRNRCPVADGVITTNAAITFWLPDKATLDALHNTEANHKQIGNIRIAYQIHEDGRCGRSFEEAFVYANLEWIPQSLDSFTATKNTIERGVEHGLADAAYELGTKIDKVDFALDVMMADGWHTPAYIDEGLKWLALQQRGR